MNAKSGNQGFSLVELLVIIAIIITLTGFVLLAVDPVEYAMKNRDARRIADLSALSQAIVTYYQDNNQTYPDAGAKTTTRPSNVLPSGNGGPLQSSGGNGWIDADFGGRIDILFTDPLNTGCNIYRYRVSSDGLRYKLDTILEYYTAKMTSDGGQDSGHYEVGEATAANPIDMGSCP